MDEAKQKGALRIFQTFPQANRYLEKKGIILTEGSIERKNIKKLFKEKKPGWEVCALKSMCLCGDLSDNERFLVMEKNDERFKKWQEGEVPNITCLKCLELMKFLAWYFTGKTGMSPVDKEKGIHCYQHIIKVKKGEIE